MTSSLPSVASSGASGSAPPSKSGRPFDEELRLQISVAVEEVVAKRLSPLEQRLERLEGKKNGTAARSSNAAATGAREDAQGRRASGSSNAPATSRGEGTQTRNSASTTSSIFQANKTKVTPELLDIGARYEMNESVWDMMVFFGLPVIGILNTFILGFAWLVNLALQAGFIFVIQTLMMEPAVHGEVLDGLLKFRLGLAHKAEFADKVTQRSMAAQICNQEKKLHLAAEQVALHQDFFNFVDGGVTAQFLVIFVQFLWLCTIAKDVSNTITLSRAVWKLRRGHNTKLVIADLIEEEMEEDGVVVTEDDGTAGGGGSSSSSAPPMRQGSQSSEDDPGPDLAGMMTVVRMTKIFPARVWLVLLLVALPKLALACALYYTGAVWLGHTSNFSDIILNGVALAFVLEFDEVLFEVFVPRRSQTLRSNFEALPTMDTKPGSKKSGIAVIVKAVLLTVAMVSVYIYILEPFFWMLRQGEAILCSGDTDFIYTVNPATKMVHISKVMGEPRYTDTELIIAQVTHVELSKHDRWEDYLIDSVYDASKSDFLRAVVASSPTSFNDIVQMSKSSLADAAGDLPCQDLASGQSRKASLQALRVLLSNDSITSCQSIPRDLCAQRSMQELRAICPRHCRCQESLLSYVGFFGKAAYGCPMQCETFKAATNEINFRFDLTKTPARRLPSAPRALAQQCQDADENVTDSQGSGCDGAYGNSSNSSSAPNSSNSSNGSSSSDISQFCGEYDDTDFTADIMCCGCGGGVGQPDASLAPPPSPSPPTMSSPSVSPDEDDQEISSLGCDDFAPADFSFAGGCSDSNGEKQLDKRGNDCASYAADPTTCGQNDDDDFNASQVCCKCGGGFQDVPSSLACWDEFQAASILPEECWRMPRKAMSWLLYVKGLFESLEFNARFSDSVKSVVEVDYAGIDPSGAVQIDLVEHITSAAMGRALANGSWDLMAGLPHPRGLTGCGFLASYEITSLLNLELCAQGVHTPIRFFCPASCGCNPSYGMNECPAGCILTSCLVDREACQHVHPWFSDECIAGWHNKGGEPTCYRCSGGATRRRRSTTCTGCEDGHFDSGDDDDCGPCPGGATRRRRSDRCTPCDPGLYDAGDLDDCAQCVGGATRRRSSNSSCTECDLGYHDGGNADDCKPNVGCETTRRRAAGCAGCPPGRYSAGGSSDDCKPCHGGETRRRDSGEGASLCTPCLAGFYGAEGQDDCMAASCPENSTGKSVPTGCSCDAGRLGAIRPLAVPPYYSGACMMPHVYLQTEGTCRYPLPNSGFCTAAAVELGLANEQVFEIVQNQVASGCVFDAEDSSPAVYYNTMSTEILCSGVVPCICLGDPSLFPCTDHPASMSHSYGEVVNHCDDVTWTYCDGWEGSWRDDSEFTATEMCCKCDGGIKTYLPHPFCDDMDESGSRTSSNGLTSCFKWDWFPSTCKWSGYYDDEDFSAAAMCCACGGGAPFSTTETTSSTNTTASETSSTSAHSTTETSSASSSTTLHSTTRTTTVTTPILSVVTGPCVVLGSCVSSPNYPADYGINERCEIDVHNPGGELLFSVMAFETDTFGDEMTIDGHLFEGEWKEAQTPTGTIFWTSDGSRVAAGWEICFGCVDNPAAAPAEWRLEDCSSVPVESCGDASVSLACCATCAQAGSCDYHASHQVYWGEGSVRQEEHLFEEEEGGSALDCCGACKAAEGCAAWNFYHTWVPSGERVPGWGDCMLLFPAEGAQLQHTYVTPPEYGPTVFSGIL